MSMGDILSFELFGTADASMQRQQILAQQQIEANKRQVSQQTMIKKQGGNVLYAGKEYTYKYGKWERATPSKKVSKMTVEEYDEYLNERWKKLGIARKNT